MIAWDFTARPNFRPSPTLQPIDAVPPKTNECHYFPITTSSFLVLFRPWIYFSTFSNASLPIISCEMTLRMRHHRRRQQHHRTERRMYPGWDPVVADSGKCDTFSATDPPGEFSGKLDKQMHFQIWTYRFRNERSPDITLINVFGWFWLELDHTFVPVCNKLWVSCSGPLSTGARFGGCWW